MTSEIASLVRLIAFFAGFALVGIWVAIKEREALRSKRRGKRP